MGSPLAERWCSHCNREMSDAEYFAREHECPVPEDAMIWLPCPRCTAAMGWPRNEPPPTDEDTCNECRDEDVRRLLLDVIILDSESDDAPSLADMARRARKLLEGSPSERSAK